MTMESFVSAEQPNNPKKLESKRLIENSDVREKYLQKELVKLSRDESGNVDGEKLEVLGEKIQNDEDFAQIVRNSVDNRLRGLGAYVAKRTAHEEVKKMATVDALTNLPNRRGFEDAVDKRLAQIARFEKSQELQKQEQREGNFWIMMLDIDKFKYVNDTFGHEMGDLILQDLAKIIKNQLRSDDFPARWGGEEFIAIVDEGRGGAAGVLAVAERLRKAVQDHKFAHDKPLTISVGVARYDGSGDIKKARESADGGLYIAKGEVAQIQNSGSHLALGQVAPQGDETRNQIWYCDSSNEYKKVKEASQNP